jgi:hypothetical protein
VENQVHFTTTKQIHLSLDLFKFQFFPTLY